MPTPDSSLRDFPFFKHLGDPELRAILRLAGTRRLAKKSVVFAQGQTANEFFVLLHGHLKVVQNSPDGREVIVRITGTTLFTVSRALSGWEEQGLVTGSRERITIKQPAKLREIAERWKEPD